MRGSLVAGAETVVVKIGTNVLTKAEGGLDQDHLRHLAEQIAEIHAAGRHVVIVSSGAIGAGVGLLGLTKRPTELPELQAAAALGQSRLMQAYDAALQPHGFHAAQILLTTEDFNDRTRYLNVRNTLLQLRRWNAVPIINENDTISVDEIRFGDNDQLAAMVANLLQAPLLVILSVVDGLYPGDYLNDPTMKPLDVVAEIDGSILGMAGTSKSGLGTGGMRSKLQSARTATSAGVSVWITNGKRRDCLRLVMAGEPIGTLMPAKGDGLAAWKRWIGFSVRPKGSLRVDAGAVAA
ncbi:MAG: glutamate 5-kinase, partial [Planctomycetia bacterium]